MTINIAVVTSEALVLGCDSIASTTDWFLPAFGPNVRQEAVGRLSATFTYDDLVAQVTNSWGGVSKMFHLHGGDTPVAAVTAGLAKLNDRTMSSFGHEFFSAQKSMGFPLNKIEAVATAFLAFMRQHYDSHYEGSAVPGQFRDGPHFLLGGYGKFEHLPALYRVHVETGDVRVQFPTGDSRYGVAWDGQADAVERLLRGCDNSLKFEIENAVKDGVAGAHQSMADAFARLAQQIVDQAGAAAIAGTRLELPALPQVRLPWDDFHARINYGNLPLQDAIDFTAYLVNLQSGRAKFAEGVATVGGRTHIGVVTKQTGFLMIDEPALTHRNTGFA